MTGFKLSGLLLAFIGISTFTVCCAESIPATNHINVMNRWHELRPGDVASLQIQTNPKARCIIQVIDGDTENFDEMLTSKIADETGVVKWTWKTPNTLGISKVIVVSVSGSATASIKLELERLPLASRHKSDLDSLTPEEVVGVGITFTQDEKRNTLVVMGTLKDSAARAASIKPGDILQTVDGTPVDRSNVDVAISKIRGPVGTKVVLGFAREGKEHFVTLPRVRFIVPVGAGSCNKGN